MRSSDLIAAVAVIAMTTAAAAQQPPQSQSMPSPRPKVLASCPNGVSFVNIIEGNYNPPAYANPDVEARDAQGSIRNEWNRLNQDPSYMPTLKAVCSYGGDTTATATRRVEVAIPRDVRLCILSKSTFACFDRRP